MARRINFFDGAESSTEPTIGNIQASDLVTYSSDAAFVADNAGAPVEGNIYKNTTLHVIRFYCDGEWKSVVDLNSIQTLINKSIDGSSNTITNVDGDEVVVDAITNLDATNAQAAFAEHQSDIDDHETRITQNEADITQAESDITTLQSDVAGKIDSTEKGAANGVATLDGNSRLPAAQLPTSAMEYKGAWNANTNSPSLVDGVGDNGDQYRVSVAGTQDLGSGSETYAVGDVVIYNGSIWEKIPADDAVTSVNGLTGAVSLDTDDIPEATNEYYTNAKVDARIAAASIGDLTDVDLTTPPTDGQVLKYDSIGGNFIPGDDLEGSGGIPQLIGGGNVSWGAGAFVNSTSYDTSAGSAECAIPHNPTYFGQTDNISVFMWFKTNRSTDEFFFSQYDFGNGGQKWGIGQRGGSASGAVEFLVSTGPNFKQYQSTAAVNDNNWHFAGFTFSSGTFKVFLDGVELTGGNLNIVNDDAFASLNNSTVDIMIGSLLNNGNPAFSLQGRVDELTYWDKALSGAEVTELWNGGEVFDYSSHSASINLMEWYRFDGDTLPTVTGQINGQDGTADVNAVLVSDAPTGGNVELVFDDNFFLEVNGLSYSDNTIPTSESPLTLNNDGDVAYVIPNEVAPGGNLTVVVDTLDNVPENGVIITRRIGNDMVVGDSTKLKIGETAELYEIFPADKIPYSPSTPGSWSSIPSKVNQALDTLADDINVFQSGATGSRPASPVIGQAFFDTTIGLPIWYDGTNWIDAAGNTV